GHVLLGGEQDEGVGPHRLLERKDRLLASDEEGRDHVRKYDGVAQRQHRIGPGLTGNEWWSRLSAGHVPKSVLLSLCLLKTSSHQKSLPTQMRTETRSKFQLSIRTRKFPVLCRKFPVHTPKNFPPCSTGRSNFVTAWLYQSSRAIGISHI